MRRPVIGSPNQSVIPTTCWQQPGGRKKGGRVEGATGKCSYGNQSLRKSEEDSLWQSRVDRSLQNVTKGLHTHPHQPASSDFDDKGEGCVVQCASCRISVGGHPHRFLTQTEKGMHSLKPDMLKGQGSHNKRCMCLRARMGWGPREVATIWK